MKKRLRAWKLEEVRSFRAPIQNITSYNRSADSYTKKYVIIQYADKQ